MLEEHANENIIVLNVEEIREAERMDFNSAVHYVATCYIKAGIPVLPLEPNSKKLPVAGGISYLSATLKKQTVDKWFAPGGKYVGHNIGIGCGLDGGVMALDIDAKIVPGTSTTGIKELAKILEFEGELPPGPCQTTPSGGFHHLYVWQKGASSSSGKVAPGIDTRGGMANKCTGHIVAYPSTIDGKRYEWASGGHVPPMPEWLSARLGKPWEQKSSDADGKEEKIEVPIHQVNRMLSVISPDDVSYEDWVKIGMVLKYMYADDGLEIWDEWSKDGARRKDGECKSRWGSFGDDPGEGSVGFGTLLFMARDAGWRPIPGDITASTTGIEVEERVQEMNKRYAVMRVGKNALIATFDKNANGTRVGFLTAGSFNMMMANESIFIKGKKHSITDIWLADPRRREYYDMGIYPNNDEPSGTLNMWNGWGVEPDPNASCEKYLKHMEGIVCNGNLQIYEWLLDWMADCVQDARTVKGSCVVLMGIEGCGKGIWADNFGKLFGKHYTHIIDAERLTTRFNSMMADSVIVFADEVLFPGDRKSANVLKGLISETVITREAKGVDPVEQDNLNRVIIASNEEWVIPAGPQSRRYLVLKLNGAMANNKIYFDGIVNEMNNGGRGALLHFLLNRKITNNLRFAPSTRALVEQRKMSSGHDSLLQWMLEVVEKNGFESQDVSAQVGDGGDWPMKLNKYELFSEYRTWTKETRVSNYDVLSMPVFLGKIESYGFIESKRDLEVPSVGLLRNIINEKQGSK